MNARRTAGWAAVLSGSLLVVVLVWSALTGAVAGSAGTTNPWSFGAGMMGAGSGWMGSAHGMMGAGSRMMGFGASGPAASAIPGATEVRVQAANFAFDPSEIRLPKSAEVNLTFTNPGGTGVVHDLTVPALGIHVVASPGETRTIGLRGLTAGRYDAYCSVPGHADLGMRGTVIVD